MNIAKSRDTLDSDIDLPDDGQQSDLIHFKADPVTPIRVLSLDSRLMW